MPADLVSQTTLRALERSGFFSLQWDPVAMGRGKKSLVEVSRRINYIDLPVVSLYNLNKNEYQLQCR